MAREDGWSASSGPARFSRRAIGDEPERLRVQVKIGKVYE